MKTTTLTADKVRSSKPELLRAMRAADAIARATKEAVLRHAQLDESVAMEVDGQVLVVPAKTLVRRWRRLGVDCGQDRKRKR